MSMLIHFHAGVSLAAQSGTDQPLQWRTPPFKALLRQWWRVAAANEPALCIRRSFCRFWTRILRAGKQFLSGSLQ